MATARVERRLAAILAADVVGYSRLMERDEDRTLARLKAHRREFIEPLIAEYQGRVVKLMGDGALVEFASVVDAVRCAVLIQRGMAERVREVDEPAVVGPLTVVGIDGQAEQEVGRRPGGERGQGLGREIVLRGEGDLDVLAGLALEGGDEFPDHIVLSGIDLPQLPPDDEVGAPGDNRRQRERGGEEDGPDPHGAAP